MYTLLRPTKKHNHPMIHTSSHIAFPPCIANIIAGYAEEIVLLKAIKLLEKREKSFKNDTYSCAEGVFHKPYFRNISSNPAAMCIIRSNLNKICWQELSTNPAAISILEYYPDKINWAELSTNPAAIFLLKKNPNRIDWGRMLMNPAAETLSNDNPDKTDPLMKLCVEIKKINHRENPAIIYFAEKIFSIEESSYLSKNPAAIHLLRDNPCSGLIFSNPAIFKSNRCDIYRLLVFGDVIIRTKNKRFCCIL